MGRQLLVQICLLGNSDENLQSNLYHFKRDARCGSSERTAEFRNEALTEKEPSESPSHLTSHRSRRHIHPNQMLVCTRTHAKFDLPKLSSAFPSHRDTLALVTYCMLAGKKKREEETERR